MKRSKFLAFAAATLSVVAFPWFPLSNSAQATGVCETNQGTVTTGGSGNVVILTFNAPASGNGNCTFAVPEDVFIVDYLVVAGGGGGASGGGGAGGVVTNWEQDGASPLTVEPGTEIDIVVGAGGAGGAGGAERCITSGCLQWQTVPQNGNNSIFGSVVANGGGAGGHRRWNNTAQFPGTGGVGGSSGGASYDNANSVAVDPNRTTVVGALSFGSAGGQNPGSGGYRAGAGGGGAGASGGETRVLANGCGAEGCTANRHGGGHGGAGVTLTISGSSQTYGCGGGGGVNSNNRESVTNGGGNPGCDSAGKGSSWATFNNDDNLTGAGAPTGYAAARAGSGAAGFGGGGGGTDPEDINSGAGGSGVVIVRYTLVDDNCPNNGTNSASAPLACPTTLTVVGDGSTSTVSVLGSPVSFSGSGATLIVRSSPRANPTSGNMSVTPSGNNLSVTVPPGSSLVGGTYPVVYRISQSVSGSTVTSDSYVLVTVQDPGQLTPGTVPLDPRDDGIILPRIELGAAPNVRLCLTLQSNLDQLTLSAGASAGVNITNEGNNRLILTGTNSDVEAAVNGISIVANPGSVLVPNVTSRNIDVNVSNTNNGGNGSCTFGTSSTITLRNLQLSTSQHLLVELD